MSSHASSEKKSWRDVAALTLAALGVVYGDIGTSPLYALKESIHHTGLSQMAVLGILSWITWSLILIVSTKYVYFLLSIDHHGEGGLTALITIIKKKVSPIHVILGIFGVSLLYGDGLITPAISVLSAMEGLKVISPALERLVIPFTVLILVGLFSIQRYGTSKVGRVFGPAMIVWFTCLALLGMRGIVQHPQVLVALNPWYAVQFVLEFKWIAFVTLGSIVLVITGGEALYADMGHFGALPVRIGWLGVAFPSLLLNYFGQGALVLLDSEAAENPFYMLSPEWFQVPLVFLATFATVIASQALITGCYSLTKSLSDLHALPPLEVVSTSKVHHGQIYMPLVNKALMFGCIALVLLFETSSNLAAAYGIAVTGTMGITSWLWYLTLTKVKAWKRDIALLLFVVFFSVDMLFFSANLLKFFHGGWIPLVIAVVLTIAMEWYYFHNRSLLKAKKEPLSKPCSFNYAVSSVIVFVDEYVHNGTRLLLGTAKSLGLPYRLIHISTRQERRDHLVKHIHELGEEIEIIESPSGDLLHPATDLVKSVCQEVDGEVWVLIGQTIVPGETSAFHPNGDALMNRLQVLKGVVIVRVPWVVKDEAPKHAGVKILSYVNQIVK